MPFDWHQIIDEQSAAPVAVTRDRVRWLLAMFALALAVILARAVQLEISDGENFRRLAVRPIERRVELAAPRGRILRATVACWPRIVGPRPWLCTFATCSIRPIRPG